jgi:hypothetical protein
LTIQSSIGCFSPIDIGTFKNFFFITFTTKTNNSQHSKYCHQKLPLLSGAKAGEIHHLQILENKLVENGYPSVISVEEGYDSLQDESTTAFELWSLFFALHPDTLF